jgi:hypothetical protein
MFAHHYVVFKKQFVFFRYKDNWFSLPKIPLKCSDSIKIGQFFRFRNNLNDYNRLFLLPLHSTNDTLN